MFCPKSGGTRAAPCVWTLLPQEMKSAPVPLQIASLPEALGKVSMVLRKTAKPSRERVDLDQLATPIPGEWDGQLYAQTLLIPDAVFDGLCELHGVKPLVLLPPDTRGSATIAVSGSQSSASDAVVIFVDAYGAVKGLPPNERATLLCAACGLEDEPRGDVFIGRLNLAAADGTLVLGAEAPPEMIGVDTSHPLSYLLKCTLGTNFPWRIPLCDRQLNASGSG
jgi:hypothetical protein